jgi:hypothetical protein
MRFPAALELRPDNRLGVLCDRSGYLLKKLRLPVSPYTGPSILISTT